MLGERRPQALEISPAKRDWAATGAPSRRVREPDERLALLSFEELDKRREPLLPRALRKRELLDQLRLPPRCRRLSFHAVNVAGKPSRVCAGFVSELRLRLGA